MVNWAVEGQIDNKSEIGAVSKEKRKTLVIYSIAMIEVSNAMLSGQGIH
jgi:hypothetical protein